MKFPAILIFACRTLKSVVSTHSRTKRTASLLNISNLAMAQEARQKLNLVKDSDIDPSGRFKYILAKIYVDDPNNKDLESEVFKYVVRGYADCPYHADIYEGRLQPEIRRIGGLDSECVGGGRILHEGKKLTVFGYSQGYGQADHSKAVEILKKDYPDYNVSWNNEGY